MELLDYITWIKTIFYRITYTRYINSIKNKLRRR